MNILTVQRYKDIQRIYSSEGYKPDFAKSSYAYASRRYTRAYLEVLNKLSKKTGKDYLPGLDSCIWGWSNNPFLGFYESNKGKRLEDRRYAMFCSIPESDMVYSDYDKYCDFIEENTNDKNFFVDSPTGAECVQCCFWSLRPENINVIVDLDNIKSNNLWLELTGERARDQSFLFDQRYLQCMA